MSGPEEIRNAINAFNTGETGVADVEGLDGNALAAGSVSPMDAGFHGRSAGKSIAIAPEMTSRLGPDDSAPLGSADTVRYGRGASEGKTRIRFTGASSATRLTAAPAPELTDHAPDLSTKSAAVTDGGTDALWVDPEPNPVSSTGSDLIGRLLGGRYLLERELGAGGMGVVYLASDQEVKGEHFAVKVLKPEIRAHPESLSLLREEVRTTRALRHPNIVGVYSLNSDRSNIYMLMEYLEGKTLDALLDHEFGRGMPFSRAWPLITDMRDALAYAHDHNVIHSDLKPSNVFVTFAGRAKLLDFGIARVARTRSGRFDPGTVGALTVAYASCEMLEGLKPDQSDDVYALACVIYEMLSGRHPYDLRSALEARDAGATVAPIASLTSAQNAALAQALASGRTKRTTSVEALLSGLDPAAPPATRSRGLSATLLRGRHTGSTVPVRNPTFEPWTARWFAPNRLLIGLIALVSIGMISGLTVIVYRMREHVATAPTKEITAGTPPSSSTAVPSEISARLTATESSGAPSVAVAPTSPSVVETEPSMAAAPSPVEVSKPPASSAAGTTPSIALSKPPTYSVPPSTAVKSPKQAAAISQPVETREADVAQLPPAPRHAPPVIPLQESESAMDSCPYPKAAVQAEQTGSVGLLVFIAPDGTAVSTKLDETSGSDALDQAAVSCVQEHGRFPSKAAGSKSRGFWGHMRFNWSIGG